MNSFLGMNLVANPQLVERKTVRIRGGYLDRWLIRAEILVPSTKIYQNRIDGTYHCHPDLLDRIRNELGTAAGAVLPVVQNVATAMDSKARARRRSQK